MTARTKPGYKGHTTHGADSGTPHGRLVHQHTHGKRPPGRPAGEPGPTPMPQDLPGAEPPVPEGAPQPTGAGAPPGLGAEPPTDDEDADQT